MSDTAVCTCILMLLDFIISFVFSKFFDVSFGFYERKQLLVSARLSHCNSVCPSVRSSHGWISQKRCKLGSSNLHHLLHGRL